MGIIYNLTVVKYDNCLSFSLVIKMDESEKKGDEICQAVEAMETNVITMHTMGPDDPVVPAENLPESENEPTKDDGDNKGLENIESPPDASFEIHRKKIGDD